MIAPTTSTSISVEALYRALATPRAVEDKMLRLIRQGRISKWFSGYGQEAIAVGTAWALSDRDYILPMHRNLGVWTTRNVPMRPLLCQLFGREGAFTQGRDRTFHFGLPSHRIIGMISHMAAMLPVACGLGQALAYKDEDAVAVAFCGDGGTREGDFHEALNLAAVWELPVIFLVENNGYGLSTPTHEALAETEIASLAAGYGMPGRSIDGNDIFAVLEAVSNARRTAQRQGPVLLEMRTFRRRGHEEASGTAYVPDELIQRWAERDPIERFEEYLRTAGGWSEDECIAVRDTIMEQVEADVEWALDQPSIESTPERERDAVYAPGPIDHPAPPPLATDRPNDTPTQEQRFIDAIQEALDEALDTAGDVVLMGQDIAEYGGVFKVTEGFLDKYGPQRIRNTPIIESGAVGAGLGLAIEGLRPVLEIQYADFISCGFNQIVNNLAKTHYRWEQPVNVTIRAPYGGGIGAGPFHSQSPEAWFAHVPGLKVVMPSTPADAKGLLHSALHDPNPTLFFEQKKLYRSIRGEVPPEPYRIPLGQARVARSGTDATIVTYGIGVHWALDEAAHWAKAHDCSIAVIDLRTLVPWDKETVRASLEETSRVLVLHEATRTAGFGAELAAEITEDHFELLDAPPIRVTGADTPIPATKELEDTTFSAKRNLCDAIERLLAY